MRRNPKGSPIRWLAVVLSLSLVAAACGGDDDDAAGGETGDTEDTGEPGEGGTLIFGADQDFNGYNVETAKDNQLAAGQIMRNVWATAYRVRPDFSLEPYLIRDEATVVSEDPFTVEWRIRDEAVWDDGTAVTANDLEFPAQMCNGRTEGASCASTSGFDLITEMTKPDPKTLRAVFSQPYADYKGLMVAVPHHIAVERAPGGNMVEAWNTAFDQDPGAAAGPFKVANRVKGVSLTLERNDTFWGTKANLEKIIVRFLPDSGSQVDALRNREVNMIYPQPQLDQVRDVAEISGVTSEINFGPTFEHLTLNLDNEFLAIPEVRQALAKGIDRAEIVDKLMKPFSEQATQLDNRILMSTQVGYEAHGAEYAEVDPAGAQELLEDAGFERNGDYYELDGKPLALRLSTTSGNQLRETQGVLIQAQLKRVGIRIDIQNAIPDTLFGEWLPEGNFDIANFAWVGTPFPASGAKQIFGSDSDSNYGGYASTAVDQKILAALGETDDAARLALLNEVDEMLWDDMPLLPLYQKPTFLAHSEAFVNIEDNTTEESPFWNSEEWALRASAR